jgi:hypothetical protein
LVVANQTAGSDELLEALRKRVEGGPAGFTLLIPCGPGGRTDARTRLNQAVDRMRAAGLEVDGRLGDDPNPLFAITEVWDAASYDEIVISTFPSGTSHWMNLDLPQRVAKITDAPVEHVVSAKPADTSADAYEAHSPPQPRSTSDKISGVFGTPRAPRPL